MSLKRTPLFARHTQLGGRIIEFGGWQMPVFYTSILEEHHAVRSAAGLFDISHMGQFQVQGPSAKNFLNVLLTNDLSKLKPGLGQYTLLCAEDGGVIDDLYVFELAPQAYRLVVNASRMPDDAHWFESQWHQRFTEAQVQFTNLSDEWGGLAVQGPRVADFIDTVFPPRQPIAQTTCA